MPARAIHCPFLNRTDSRCSSHFSLDRLNDAFDQCLGAYQACPVYLELLAERRQRRSEAAMALRVLHGNAATPHSLPSSPDGKTAARDIPIVPLTFANGRQSYPPSHA